MESLVFAVNYIFLYNCLSFEYGNKAITDPYPTQLIVKQGTPLNISICHVHLPTPISFSLIPVCSNLYFYIFSL